MRTLVLPALVVAFTVYCLIDVLRSDESDVRGLPKLPWVFIVLLFPLAGGAAWFVAGRPRGSRPPGTDRVGRPRPRVVGPDDDPDFLRTIDRPSPRPTGPLPPQDPAPPGRGRDDAGGTEGREAPGDAGGPGGTGTPDGPDGADDADGRDDRRP